MLVVAPSFTTFLVGWALQGAYVVWLPLEVAIIYRRTAGSGRQALLTRRAAAVLVGALELAVIIGALTSGALVEADVDAGAARAAGHRGDPVPGRRVVRRRGRQPGPAAGGFDWTGLALRHAPRSAW